MKKVLFITNTNPFSKSFGAEQRSFVYLNAFVENGFEVDVAYVGLTNETKPEQTECAHIVYWNNGHKWKYSRIKQLARYVTIDMYPVSFELEKIIDGLVDKGNYDYMACRYIPTAAMAGLAKYADRLLLDIDDMPEPAMVANMSPDKWYKNVYHKLMLFGVRRNTRFWLKHSKCCFVPDKSVAKEYGCTFLPNIPLYHVDTVEFNHNKAILFIGLLSFRPNWEGIDWFLKNCWGSIVERIPETVFYIAGKGLDPKKRVEWESYDNVRPLGFVDDILEFYSLGNVVVVPVFSGSGTNIKVVEAMACGKAVVLTPFSLKGYEMLFYEEPICSLVTNNEQEFTNKVIDLLLNNQKCELAAQISLDKVTKHYSQKMITEIVLNQISLCNV